MIPLGLLTVKPMTFTEQTGLNWSGRFRQSCLTAHSAYSALAQCLFYLDNTVGRPCLLRLAAPSLGAASVAVTKAAPGRLGFSWGSGEVRELLSSEGYSYKHPFEFCVQNTGGSLSCPIALWCRWCLDLSHFPSLALTVEVWESGFKVHLWGDLRLGWFPSGSSQPSVAELEN